MGVPSESDLDSVDTRGPSMTQNGSTRATRSCSRGPFDCASRSELDASTTPMADSMVGSHGNY